MNPIVITVEEEKHECKCGGKCGLNCACKAAKPEKKIEWVDYWNREAVRYE